MLRSFFLASALLSAASATAMSLTSSDISDGKAIPAAQLYARCGGQNISPQLSWSGAPPGTESYVVTMIDLDVKPSKWSHWIVANIPGRATSLASGADTVPAKTAPGASPSPVTSTPRATMPDGAVGIVSNFGDPFYDGPCPPPGSGTHHYQLTVWAMPAPVFNSIDPDEKATDVMVALARASLASASIAGFVSAPEKAP